MSNSDNICKYIFNAIDLEIAGSTYQKLTTYISYSDKNISKCEIAKVFSSMLKNSQVVIVNGRICKNPEKFKEHSHPGWDPSDASPKSGQKSDDGTKAVHKTKNKAKSVRMTKKKSKPKKKVNSKAKAECVNIKKRRRHLKGSGRIYTGVLNDELVRAGEVGLNKVQLKGKVLEEKLDPRQLDVCMESLIQKKKTVHFAEKYFSTSTIHPTLNPTEVDKLRKNISSFGGAGTSYTYLKGQYKPAQWPNLTGTLIELVKMMVVVNAPNGNIKISKS